MGSRVSALELLCIIFLGLIIFIFYVDTLGIYFFGEVWNDFAYIEVNRNNLYIGAGPATIRPVKHALQDLILSIFGLNPIPYHAIVLSLHSANSIFVFYIAKRIFTSKIAGFFAALLFATFWADPEAVVWHLGIQEVLTVFFSLCCLISFCRYREVPTQSNYLLTLFVFTMALGCKENAAIFLLPLMYLVDRYLLVECQEMSKKITSHKTSYVPFLLISVIWLALLTQIAHERGVWEVFDLKRFPINVQHALVFPLSFPVLSEGPRFGNINLAILVIFYFVSPAQIRKRVLLLMAGLLVVSLPMLPLGCPGQRHIYFPSAFSMVAFTCCIYYLFFSFFGRIGLKESMGKLSIAFLIFVLVYFNYSFINREVEYYKHLGKVSETLWEGIQTTFPKGTINTQLVFVNFPFILNPPPGRTYFGPRQQIFALPLPLIAIYGVDKNGPVYEVTLPEVWDGSHPLSPSATNISFQQFDELTKKTNNKVYFFNPKDNSIHDVTEKDVDYLRALLASN